MSFNRLQKEDEILSREDEKVRQMLGGLKKIDAPADFDFRLKARIAAARPEDFAPPRLFPILRYAAPLGLAIVVLGILVFNGLYSFDSQTISPVVAENFTQKADEKEKLPVESVSSEKIISAAENAAPNTNIEILSKKENPTFPKNSETAANPEKAKSRKTSIANNGGGSRDSALSKSKVILPQGLTQKKAVVQPGISDDPVSFSVKDILSPIGIEAVFSENKWKVVSVKKDSLAERSGVKPDDVIEAIDENRISGETVFIKTFSGKNLNVERGGKRLEIKLQNK